MPDLERLVTLTPAYDRRHSDPKRNYGIGPVELCLAVRGPAGAVTFAVLTARFLPHVVAELLAADGRAWPAGLAAALETYAGDFPDPSVEAVHKEVVAAHTRAKLLEEYGELTVAFRPLGADVAYHSPTPKYDGQKPSQGTCPYLAGDRPCYADGSARAGEELFDVFLLCGPEAVWRDLEITCRKRLED